MATAPPIGAMLRVVPKLTLRLSEESRAGWEQGCRTYGCSLTALVEAIGLAMATDAEMLGRRGADIVEAAKAIDAERRARG